MPKTIKSQHEKRDKQWERLDALLARNFSASYMSNAKWTKLLKAVCSFQTDVPVMEYKLVYSDEITRVGTEPYEEHVDPYWFIEPTIYKEIEWLEFPFNSDDQLEAFESILNDVANFPIIRTGAGLRILGYKRLSNSV